VERTFSETSWLFVHQIFSFFSPDVLTLKLQHSDSNFLFIYQASYLLDMFCSEKGDRSHTLQSLSFTVWNLGKE
jgi:hypothetical protein